MCKIIGSIELRSDDVVAHDFKKAVAIHNKNPTRGGKTRLLKRWASLPNSVKELVAGLIIR